MSRQEIFKHLLSRLNRKIQPNTVLIQVSLFYGTKTSLTALWHNLKGQKFNQTHQNGLDFSFHNHLIFVLNKSSADRLSCENIRALRASCFYFHWSDSPDQSRRKSPPSFFPPIFKLASVSLRGRDQTQSGVQPCSPGRYLSAHWANWLMAASSSKDS